MGKTCCVYGCTKRGGRDRGVSFFSVPAVIHNQGDKTREVSFKRRQAWVARINRKEWVPSSSSRVCSEHFLSGEYTVVLMYMRYTFDVVMHI